MNKNVETLIGQAKKERHIVKLIKKVFTSHESKSMTIRLKKSVFDLRWRGGGAEGI
jgi:hypothetical protein